MSRRSLSILTLFALVTAAGCGSAWRAAEWIDHSAVTRPAQADYPDQDAVYLEREVALFQHIGGTKPTWFVRSVHAALVVLNESGRRFSDVRVRYDEDDEIVDMAARSIAPDGTVTPLEPERIYEDDPEEEGDTKIRVFALPRVQVGSIIEYRYALRRENSLRTTWTEYLWAPLPSKRTRISYTVHESGRATARGYGIQTPFELRRDGDYATISWEGTDLLDEFSEVNSPPKQERIPHVVFVLFQVTNIWERDYHSEWSDSVRREFYEPLIEEREHAAGLSLSPALAELRSLPTSERVHEVFDFVRAIPYLGEQELKLRPMMTILTDRNADDWEKTALLVELLRAVGVKATYALVRPKTSGTIDRALPRYGVFTHGLVHVPSQPGIDAPIWLQPWCSHCDGGQLQRKLIGVDALLLERKGGASKPRWVVAEAPPEPLAARRIERDIVVSPAGGVTVSQRGRYAGQWGSYERYKKTESSERDYRERVEGWITNELEDAAVDNITYVASPVGDSAVDVSLRWQSDAPVTRAGDRLVLDLTAPAFDAEFVEQEPRRSDLVLHYQQRSEYVYRLAIPAGYDVLEVPQAVALTAPCGEATSTWARDGDQLVYTVTIDTHPGRWSKDALDPHREWVRELDRLRDVKLTLVPSTAGR